MTKHLYPWRARPIQLSEPKDAADYFFRLIGNEKVEVTAMLCISERNRIKSAHVLAWGVETSAVFPVKELFLIAQVERVSSIILAHTHPGGAPTPSPEDKNVTKKFLATGRALNIYLLDHIIIGSNHRYYSFSEHGGLKC